MMTQKPKKALHIAVGINVEATFESPENGVSKQLSGKVIEVGGPLGQPNKLLATVLWANGVSTTVNAMFFMKTMNIVGATT